MRFSKILVAVVTLATYASAQAQMRDYKNVGRTPTQTEIQAWSISIGPDGKNLPPGSGTAKDGAVIYVTKCQRCHGPNGQGGPIVTYAQAGYPVRLGPTLAADKAAREATKPGYLSTVGQYWPYATIAWDYINRAMPRGQGGTLTPNEVYSLTAFILYKGGIIQESDIMDAKTLPKVQMPNRNGFVPARFEDIPNFQKRGCTQGICQH